MDTMRVVLSVAWIPLLSGCMMMGGGMTPLRHQAQIRSSDGLPPRVEARSGNLTIALTVAAPSSGTTVPLHVRLRTDGGAHSPADASVWLLIRTPEGSVEKLHMEPVDHAPGLHQAQYTFESSGRYVLTAEASIGNGADVRKVSVTMPAEVRGTPPHGSAQENARAARLGGLGMAAMIILMMGVAAF